MKELPQEALTLISRARVLEKLIKDGMADSPFRATLGELLCANPELFDNYIHQVQWAGRVRNACAHVADEEFSVVEIRRAIHILDSAIAEMKGVTIEVVTDVGLQTYEPPETPYFFSNGFYAKAAVAAILVVLMGLVAAKLFSR